MVFVALNEEARKQRLVAGAPQHREGTECVRIQWELSVYVYRGNWVCMYTDTRN